MTDTMAIRAGLSLESQGRELVKRNELDSALMLFDSALTILTLANDTAGIGSVWFYKARTLDRAGDIEASIQAWRHCIAWRELMNPDTVNALGKAIANLGNLYNVQGRLDTAMHLYSTADSVMRVKGAKPFDRALMHNNMAVLSQAMGDHGRAVELAKRAKAVLEDTATRVSAAYDRDMLLLNSEVNLALSFSDLGEQETAIQLGRSALARVDRALRGADARAAIEWKVAAFRTHTVLQDPYTRLSRNEEALSHALHALPLALEVLDQSPIEWCAAYGNVAMQAFHAGNYPIARIYLDSSLFILDAHLTDPQFRAHGAFPGTPMLIALRGALHLMEGDPNEAEILFHRSKALLKEVVEPPPMGHGALAASSYFQRSAELHAMIAQAHRLSFDSTGRSDALLRSIEEYGRALEQVKALMASVDLTNRSQVSGVLWYLFGTAIETNAIAFERKKDPVYADNILAFMECSRNALADKSKLSWTKTLPTDAQLTLEAIGILEEKLYRAEHVPDIPLDSTEVLRKELLALREGFKRSHPTHYHHVYHDNTPSVASVRNGLVSQACVISYFEGEKDYHALGIHNDTLLYLRTSRADLHEPLSEMIEGLAQHGPSNAHSAPSRVIHRRLVAPLLRGQERQIRVVPDGLLWRIPFDLILDPGVAAPADLITDREGGTIYYGLSAGGSIGRSDRSSALDNYMGYAPGHFGTLRTDLDDVDAEGPLRSEPAAYTDLLGTIKEVREAAKVLGGEARIAEQATEGDVRAQARKVRILQFATHSVANDARPERSVLYLYGARSSISELNSPNDGRLYLDEVQDLDLFADLVVLSACGTGRGPYKRGEGVMSFARAFNYAGVSNVVASLWKVDDRATKDIMVKFYEHLADGLGKADALAEAKRWYRRENPNAPPSHWAAFILIGDNEPVHLRKRSPIKPWMMVIGLLLLGSGGFIVQRMRRRAASAA